MNGVTQPEPRVSVIIPTYNRASLLPETLESVQRQTFVRFEILLVDDGSTDNTQQVIQGIPDSRIVYIHQAHSGLPAVARNTGLRHAGGEYIAFLDSDDLWLPDKLKKQVQYLDTQTKVGLVHANAFKFTEDPQQADEKLMLCPGEGLSGHAFNRLYGNPKILSLTVMLRCSVVNRVGLFDEDKRLKANEDYEYWLRVARHFPLGYIDEPLAKYREHAEGISKASVASNQAKLFLVERLDQLYPDFVAAHRRKRAHWLASIHYGLGRALLREDRIGEARVALRQAFGLRPTCSALLFLYASYLGGGAYHRLDGARQQFPSSDLLSRRREASKPD